MWLFNDVLVFILIFDKKYNGMNFCVLVGCILIFYVYFVKKKIGKGMEWVMCIYFIDLFKFVLVNFLIVYCYN